jgi:transcription termination factor Rho
VVILLDSNTCLARGYNRQFSSRRTITGDVDVKALERPRILFSWARNLEGHGSLTILTMALAETGSRMDDLIFQEFKRTGNMEIVLNKKAADMRIYPATDVQVSGTRREELLLPMDLLNKIRFFRRASSGLKSEAAADTLFTRIRLTKK